MATKKKATEDKPAPVAVEYVGPFRGVVERRVQIYKWNVGNNYVTNVPADVAETLIAFSEFKIKE